MLFFYCINFGLIMVGTSFGIDSIADLSQIDFVAENATLYNSAQSSAQNAFFGVLNPFGNFAQGLQIFWNLVSILMGGAILNLLGALGLPPIFMLGMQVIVMFVTVLGVFYIISGRPTESSM